MPDYLDMGKKFQPFYFNGALGGPAEQFTTLEAIAWAAAEAESGGYPVTFFRSGLKYRVEDRRLTIEDDNGRL